MEAEHQPLTIQEIPAAEAPLDLLLLADPSEEKIESYLPRAQCFAAVSGADIVGVCTVAPQEPGRYELMSIAVRPDHQQRGIGARLLTSAVDRVRESGASELEVGTGSFGYQLAFYQRHGFRVTKIDRDFFLDNYDEPIFEDGIQLLDMLRLTFRYN